MKHRRYREGSIRLRGSIYHIQWREDGRLKSESTHSTRYDDAVTLLQKRMGAIAEGRSTGREGSRLTLAQLKEMLREDYVQQNRSSWDRAERAFDAFMDTFGSSTRVSALTARRLSAYLSARLKAGVARSTVQKELAAPKRALTLAVEQGMLPYRVAFPRIGEIPNARCEFVEEWEWALVRSTLPEYWQDLGDCAMETGWRVKGELRRLTWDRVDWDRGLIRLAKYTTKNRDARTFPFAQVPEVKAALERRRAYTNDVEQRTGTPCPWVFHVDGKPISESRGLYAPWRDACKAHGVLGADGLPKRPHDFRRAAVRRFETEGVPRNVAKRLVGHRTDAMYSRYAIITDDDLRSAMSKLHQPVGEEGSSNG